MYPILNGDPNNKPKMFYLDWNTEFTREDGGSTVPTISVLKNNKGVTGDYEPKYYQNSRFINSDIESNFKTTPPTEDTDDIIAYQVFKEGDLSYEYSANTTVNTHVSFPY
jgi:hypothetical protein